MSQESLTFDIFAPRPLVIVISGPSGVGKDAVLKSLKQRQLPFHFVVTATTRPPRPGEVEGVDYFFVSREEFEEMIQKDALIEYAQVYNDLKGVPRSQVEQALASGKDVILRLDVQGAAKVRSLFPNSSVLIFLIPANDEEWLLRLQQRNTETPETLRLRLDTARSELKRLREFDYIVVNAQNRLEEAVSTIVECIHAEHHRINDRNLKQ